MSSRRTLLVVLVLIAAVAWVGRLSGGTGDDPQLADSSRLTTGAESNATSPDPSASPTASMPPGELDEVQQVAVAGVTAWQHRDAAARNAALALAATADYAAAMTKVDPAVVPECKAEEVRTDVEADGLARINVTCHTGLVLDVDVTLEDAVWRVSDIAPGT
jgi:hypothetical protein